MAGGEVAVAALLVAGLAMTQAQVPALGPCPDIETMRGFNIQSVSILINGTGFRTLIYLSLITDNTFQPT
jgi:hypothetical protein